MSTRKKRLPDLEDLDACLAAPEYVLGIEAKNDRVTAICFLPKSRPAVSPRSRLAENVCKQLTRYLDDPDFRFDLTLGEIGTPFQRSVWSALRKIKVGQVKSYGELARELSSAPRAVGQACGANPIVVVTPCHRIVAAHGIGGFSNRESGFPLNVKRWLLAHEHARWPGAPNSSQDG